MFEKNTEAPPWANYSWRKVGKTWRVVGHDGKPLRRGSKFLDGGGYDREEDAVFHVRYLYNQTR